MIKRTKIVNFDRIAPYYDSLAKLVFGSTLLKSQTCFLDCIPDNSSVLIIGGGTGYFLKELLLRTKVKNIIYIESSSKMILLAKRRIISLSYELKRKVEFRNGTEGSILPDEKFDIISTHYFLDIFKEDYSQAIVRNLSKSTNDNCIWLFADFQSTDSLKHKFLFQSMLLFFQVTANIHAVKINDYNKIFSTEGWHETNAINFYGGMIKASIFKKNNPIF